MILYIKKAYQLFRTNEFNKWFQTQTFKEQVQISKRLEKIELEGYFGPYKELDDDLSELKWVNGRRVYFAYIDKSSIAILLGGNKNGQSQDIKQAQKIFKKNFS